MKAVRLLLVLSSLSPLFILWAIRGNRLVFCTLMVVLPNVFLWLRIHVARKQNDKREIWVGAVDDHRDHLLVYLWVLLVPFDPGAMAFIIVLFWRLNLYDVNLIFALRGLRIFTITIPSGQTRYTVITKRVSVVGGERFVAYRLSDTVYLEVGHGNPLLPAEAARDLRLRE